MDFYIVQVWDIDFNLGFNDIIWRIIDEKVNCYCVIFNLIFSQYSFYKL